MKRLKNLTKESASIFLIISPFIILYIILFLESMSTAPDRAEYIRIMTFPFSGREEIGMHFFSYILGFIVSNPLHKLIVFQFICLFFLYLSFLLSSKRNALLKVLLAIVCSLFLFSVQFGIQLRVGFACVLLVFINIGLKKEPVIRNVLWYSIPCFFHIAVIPLVLALYLFYYLNIKELTKSYKFHFLIFIIMLFGSVSIEKAIAFFGLNPYYLEYLNDDADYSVRKIPFSMIFYFILLIFIYFYRKRLSFNYNIAIIPMGFSFSLIASIMEYPFFHKFMSVFLFFSVMYLISTINNIRKNELFLISLFYCLVPLGFLYFSRVVFLF